MYVDIDFKIKFKIPIKEVMIYCGKLIKLFIYLLWEHSVTTHITNSMADLKEGIFVVLIENHE